MGQTLFLRNCSAGAARPAEITSVALCTRDDEVLRPLLEAHAECRVVVTAQSAFAAHILT